MLEYVVTAVNSEPAWDQIPSLSVDNVQWSDDVGIRMTAQFCYDQENLYVRQQAVEKHIRAELNDALSMVCNDSCMEFFFCLDPDTDRYLNFELNPNGCLFLGIGTGPRSLFRQIVSNPKETFHIQTELTDTGWELRYQIPLSVIRIYAPYFTLEPGKEFRANCYKCGDKTQNRHYLTWNPVAAVPHTFHSPADFGKFILGPGI